MSLLYLLSLPFFKIKGKDRTYSSVCPPNKEDQGDHRLAVPYTKQKQCQRILATHPEKIWRHALMNWYFIFHWYSRYEKNTRLLNLMEMKIEIFQQDFGYPQISKIPLRWEKSPKTVDFPKVTCYHDKMYKGAMFFNNSWKAKV